ncbi:MAG: hypothetical protein AB1753_08225 [Thermoproteota archaeon]
MATVFLTATAYQQFTQASTTKPEEIIIDFNAFPAQDRIEVGKGKTLKVPIIVESPQDADYELKLAVVSDYMSSNLESRQGEGAGQQALPDAVTAALDKQSVALSRSYEKINDLPQGRVQRISDASIIVSAAPDATEKEHSFILEVKRALPNGDELVAGKIFTVKVK